MAAAVAANAKPMDIKNWQRRGKLKPIGRDAKGRNQYVLTDVLRVADTLGKRMTTV